MEEKILHELVEDLSSEDEAMVKKMFDAGLHWGRRRSLTHPKMRPFIFSSRGDLEIIDLIKTLEALREAKEFTKGITARGGMFLVLGTQPAARDQVQRIADELGFPYVTARWLGGSLTNFRTLEERLKDLKALEEKIKSEEFSAYTKKERLDFQRRHDELKEKFEGLRAMTLLPSALFMIGVKRHEIAVREAKKRGIPVVAVANTSDNPNGAEVVIPANDNSAISIALVLDEFRASVLEGRVEQTMKAKDSA